MHVLSLFSLILIVHTHPRCIELEEEDEEDDEGDSHSDSSEASSSDAAAPFSPPRNPTAALFEPGCHNSAFTSYVRKRGEPDGRQGRHSMEKNTLA